MLSRIRSSSLAAMLAIVAWAGSVQAASILRITEAMSSGDANDWFELTNYGTDAATLSGYKMDDNSFSFGSAVPLVSSTANPSQAITIRAGESVVFVEGGSTNPLSNVDNIRTNWGLAPTVQVYGYGGSGVGLSSTGDGVAVFDSAGTEINRVSFGATTTGLTFTWSYDEFGNLKTRADGTPQSVIGVNGAYAATNGTTALVGSPGKSILISSTAVTSLYWTADGSALGGAGTWTVGDTKWSPTASPVIGGTFSAGLQAIFSGSTAGTVTLAAPLAASGVTINTDGYTLAATGSGSLNTPGIAVTNAGQTATVTAPIVSGSGGFAKSGNGLLVLSGTGNAYTGLTSVVSGTLRSGADNVIPDGSAVSVSRFSLMDFSGKSDTVAGLQGLGGVVIGGTLTIAIAGSSDSRLDGTLSGNGDLVIASSGSGVQRLNTTTQTFNQDFSVKSYTGKTIIQSGGLGVDRTAVPLSTTQVDVEAAGRLLLSPNTTSWASAPDQKFTFGSNVAVPVNLKGGLIGQGAGDDVELGNTLNVTGTATVLIKNKAGVSGTSTSTEQFTFSGPLTGPADAVLKVLASDTTSGYAQSRAKFTSATGNTFAGTVSPGPYAVARFNGDYTQTSVKLEGGKVDGYGAIKAVTGSGVVSPDGTAGPDGIFTVGSITPVAGTNFNFDLSTANAAPVWATATQSGNDVLRLTGATPLTAGLTGSNVVNLFVNTTTLSAGDRFDAGFFTTADQTALITNANFVPYILGDGLGLAIEHSGQYYYTLAQWNAAKGTNLAATVSMVATTASFDGSTNTSGFMMRTTFAPPAAKVVINVPSGSQTQAQTGHALLSGTTPFEKTGAGVAVLDQANTLTGPTTVSQGTLQLGNAGALASSAVTVAAGATLAVGPQVQATVPSLVNNGLVDVGLGTLTVMTGLTGDGVAAAILAVLGGGTSGITSSAAAATPFRAVGWLDNGDGSVTFGYAAEGDTNLDGLVDVGDLQNILASGKYGTGQAAVWADGDFNFDGVVDVQDLQDILASGVYGQGGYNAATRALRLTTIARGGFESGFVAAGALPAGLGNVTAVPEPSTWALSAVAGMLLLMARRRRLTP